MTLAGQHRARVLVQGGPSVPVGPRACPCFSLVLAHHAVGLGIEGEELLCFGAWLKIPLGYYIH